MSSACGTLCLFWLSCCKEHTLFAGYCPGGGQPCHRFVTIIDEFGSLFDSQEELDCFRSIVAYANNEAASADGIHGGAQSWFYW